MRRFSTRLFAFVLFLLGASAVSGAANPLQLRIPYTTEKGGQSDRQIQLLAAIINKEMPGAFNVQLYPGSQLGSGTENVQGVETGTLESAALGSEGLAVDQRLGFFELPWIFSGFDQFQAAISGKLFDQVAQIFGDHQLHLIAIYGSGFRDIMTKQPVRKLSDFKGLRIRVAPSPARLALFKYLGATPVTIEWAETYIALEQGTVDGVEAFPAFLKSGKIYEQAKYLDDVHYVSAPFFIVFSEKFWSALTGDQRTRLLKAGRESMRAANDLAAREEQGNMDFMKSQGVQIVKTDLRGQEQLRATLVDDYVKKYGDTLLKLASVKK